MIKMTDRKNKLWLFSLPVVVAVLLVGSCGNGQQDHSRPLPVIDQILGDSTSQAYIDPSVYNVEMDMLPIGIFGTSADDLQMAETLLGLDEHDNITGMSGADGIKDFAGEHIEFVYALPAADSARIDMIRTIAGLFRWNDERPPVKALVVASDRASVEVWNDLQNLVRLGKLKVHTFSVLQAGINKALEYARTYHHDRNKRISVGVIAPAGTFQMKAYDRLTENVSLALQVFSSDTMPSLIHPRFKIDRELIKAYHFDYRAGGMTYRGSRFNPSQMEVNSIENAVRYAVTSLVEQLLKDSHQQLKYIILGDNILPNYKEVILESLTVLRNFRKDDRYIYRHIIDPEVILIEPHREAAIQLYRSLRKARLAAFRTTPSCIRIYAPEKPELTKYPLLHVYINN